MQEEFNRRKYPRANYPCHLTVWISDGTLETLLANTSNIGAGGICVNLNQEIVLETRVDMQIHFPGTTTPFKCHGKVLRCKPEAGRFFNIGIEFEPLSELQQAFLDSRVAELIDLEKGKS